MLDLHAFCRIGKVTGVSSASVVRLGRLAETLRGELADRLQHGEAISLEPEQTLVDERMERVEVGCANTLGGGEVEAAGEDGEPAEEFLLVVAEQAVAPLDRRSEGALTFGRIGSTPREDRESEVEACE